MSSFSVVEGVIEQQGTVSGTDATTFALTDPQNIPAHAGSPNVLRVWIENQTEGGGGDGDDQGENAIIGGTGITVTSGVSTTTVDGHIRYTKNENDAIIGGTNITVVSGANTITLSSTGNAPNALVGTNGVTVISGTTTTTVSGEDFVGNLNFAYDGTIFELESTLTHSVTSNGSTITYQLSRVDAGDTIQVQISGVNIPHTVPDTVTLTAAGSDTNPEENWIYLLESGGSLTLTSNTTGFPGVPHARVARAIVQTAVGTQTNGPLKLHAYTDHAHEPDSRGSIGHIHAIGERIREQFAEWQFGTALTYTEDTVPDPDDITIEVAAGSVFQLHPHATTSMDTSGSDVIFVPNDFTTPYTTIQSLSELTAYSDGNSIGNNQRFNIVIWGAVAENASDTKWFLNLPESVSGGGYSNDTNAIADVANTAVYSIPKEYAGVAWLIARLTVKKGVGGTWTILQNEDLRGTMPSASAGGGGGGSGVTDHGDLTGLADDDHVEYSLVSGTRPFTGTVGGVTPTADAHLTTKLYVDTADTTISGHLQSEIDSHQPDVDALTVSGGPDITGVIDFVGSGATSVTSSGNTITIDSAASTGASFSLQWRFSTITTAGQPSNGRFRYDNATLGSVTNIYFDDQSNSGFDVGTLLSTLTVGDKIYAQQNSDSTKAVLFTISSAPTDNTGWWTVPVTVDASGTLHDNNALCATLIFNIANPIVVDDINSLTGSVTIDGAGTAAVTTAGQTITISGTPHTINTDTISDAIIGGVGVTVTSGSNETTIDGHLRYTKDENDAIIGGDNVTVVSGANTITISSDDDDTISDAIIGGVGITVTSGSNTTTIDGHIRYSKNENDAIIGGTNVTVVSGANTITINATVDDQGENAFVGADGITIISGSNTTTVSGFYTEFTSASGSLQTQIEEVSSGTGNASGLKDWIQYRGNTLGSFAADSNFQWDTNKNSLRIGVAPVASNLDILVAVTEDVNDSVEVSAQNKNSGIWSTIDFSVANDLGDDTSYFGDFGMTSSNYSLTDGVANEVYIYSNSAIFTIGTETNDKMELYAGGFDTWNIMMTFFPDVTDGVTAKDNLIDVTSPIQLWNRPTSERPTTITGHDGGMAYNTTTNKFEGVENGSWVDFIHDVYTKDMNDAIVGGTNVTVVSGANTITINSTGGSGGPTASGSHFDVYDNTGGQAFTTGTITVNLDTIRTDSGASAFTLSADEVTVNETGAFLFTYRVSLSSGGNSSVVGRVWLEKDSVEIDGSSCYAYLEQTSANTTANATVLLEVTEGEVFRIRAARDSGTPTLTTVADGSSLTINNNVGGSGSASSIDSDQKTATATTSTTSTSYVQIDSMSSSPGDGTFFVTFSTTFQGTDTGQDMHVALYLDGAIVQHSERTVDFESGAAADDLHWPVQTQAILTVSGSQPVAAYYKTNTGTLTAYDRSLILLQLS